MENLQHALRAEFIKLIGTFGLASIQDHAAFLDAAERAFHALPKERATNDGARVAVLQTLCRFLHNGLATWQEDACQDVWRVCYSIASSKGAEPTRAHDIAQDIVLQLLNKPQSIRDPAALIGWILVVVSRQVKQTQKASPEQPMSEIRKGADHDGAPTELFVVEDFSTDVDGRLALTELLGVLQGCGLSTLQINVLVLCYIAHLPIAVVSERLQRLPENIRNLKSKALDKLRQSQACLERIRSVLTGESPLTDAGNV